MGALKSGELANQPTEKNGPVALQAGATPQPALDTSESSSQSFPSYVAKPTAVRSAVLHKPQLGHEYEARSRSQLRRVGAEYAIQFWLTSAPLILIDLALLTMAIAVARQLVFSMGGVAGMDVSACFLPIATGFVLLSGELGLYPGIRLSPVEELRRVVVAVTCMFAMWTVGVALLTGDIAIQRWFLLVSYCLCAISLPIGRSWGRWILGQCSWWGFPTLVCGDDAAAVRLHEWLEANRQLGLRPVGVIADPEGLELDGSEEWHAGRWSDVQEVAQRKHVYWALAVPARNASGHFAEEIGRYLGPIPHVQVLSELTGLPDHWGPHQPVDGLAGIHLQQNLLLPSPRLTKRTLDLVASLLLSVVLLPLLLVIALAVKLTSRGPIFYGHQRLGYCGRQFRAWKFRTMVVNADQVLEDYLQAHPELRSEWEQDHKLRRDPRITSIGRLLRKLSLDELPQLWNVIINEMSLVGPRPIVTAETVKYGDQYWLYSIVKPGITGLWQVSGRNNTTYEERVQFDSYYVRNWSPWLDLYLLMRTVKIVFFAEGAY